MHIASHLNSVYFGAVIGVASGLMVAPGFLPAYGGEKILHSFDGGSDGNEPYGGLIADNAGNLYGTTLYGGGSGCGGMGCGTVFKVSPKGRETVLHAFKAGDDGSWPVGTLLADGSGNLFGTTARGGGTGCSGTGCGTVFKLAPDGTETVLYAFQGGSDGQNPWGGVIADGAGNLYGLTVYGGNFNGSECADLGCGTLYELQPEGGKLALYTFQAGEDGAFPGGAVITDAAGNLYGTTSRGGESDCSGGCGTVFKWTPGGSETVLHAFQANGDGDGPISGLIADAAGNLYGTTPSGGAAGWGTVFKVTTGGQETVLYSFQAGADGADPQAGLVMDDKGNLYGTSYAGGANACNYGGYKGCGTVFELNRKGVETVLYSFSNAQGTNPVGGLILRAHHAVFGTTSRGGPEKHDGVVFKLKAK
ncbi:MAG TPA: choice-of-anchor tandem repeat GloVer-containing protein [Rhizomicrobium sp.]|jgi:uncharacterized repeat protein (TIGR03803 family)|nr:choice-of-anchor tandem repeat GloVer-containing protein [Rhizomicrobium sp.]